MQVSQTVVLRREDEHRVDVRDIDTRLDDRGGDEDVVIVIDKILQSLCDLVGRHLSVGNHHTCLGTQPVQPVLNALQHIYPVADDEHLPVARHLNIYRLLDDILVVERDALGDHGIAVRRRSGHYAQVARAEQ